MKRFILPKVSLVILSGFLFFTASCGSSSSGSSSNSDASGDSSSLDELINGVDEDFIPHLEEFVAEANARSIDVDVSEIEIVYAPVDDGVAGVCFIGQGLIQVSPFFRQDDTHLRELIYHELGHCVLGMEHRPNGIMNPDRFVGVTPALLDEFFSPQFFFELDVENDTNIVEVKRF